MYGLYKKKDPFSDTAAYNPVRLMVWKIRYMKKTHFTLP